jgi:sterol 3beta-glucosyltransferase
MFSRLFSRSSTTKSELPDTDTPPPDVSGQPESDDSSQLEPQGTPFSQLYTEAANFEKMLLHSGCINPAGVCPKGTTGFANLVGCDLSKCERALLDRDAQLHAVEAPWFLPDSDSDDDSQEHQPTPEGFTLSHITQPDIHRASSVDNQCLTYLEPKDIVNILIREFGPVAAPGDEEKLLLEADGCLIHDIAVVVSLFWPIYIAFKI